MASTSISLKYTWLNFDRAWNSALDCPMLQMIEMPCRSQPPQGTRALCSTSAGAPWTSLALLQPRPPAWRMSAAPWRSPAVLQRRRLPATMARGCRCSRSWRSPRPSSCTAASSLWERSSIAIARSAASASCRPSMPASSRASVNCWRRVACWAWSEPRRHACTNWAWSWTSAVCGGPSMTSRWLVQCWPMGRRSSLEGRYNHYFWSNDIFNCIYLFSCLGERYLFWLWIVDF